jgi:3-hydroxybutyryl-CoA dehydrogenase
MTAPDAPAVAAGRGTLAPDEAALAERGTLAPAAAAFAERLAVVGSGTIACGLAAVAARHGDVALHARSTASAKRARATVDKGCAKLEVDPARVRIAASLDGVERATFVVEAIAEDAAAKRAVLAELHDRLDSRALLASTTSSLSVTELAAASGRPGRFLGFHVFHPVAKMPLVELAFPAAAEAATRARASALVERLGKRPVDVPDTAGFVVNRLLFPYLFDAVRIADRSGLAPADVDACMTLGAGHPMGPLALLDLVGLDVAAAIGRSLGLRVPRAIRDRVAQGSLGRKAGRGFYCYS